MRRGGPRICSFRLQVHFTPLQLLLTFFGGRTVNKARLSPNLGRVTSVTTEDHDTGQCCVTQILDLLHKIFHHHDDVGSLLTPDRWFRERSEIHDRSDDDKRDCCRTGHNLVQIFIDVLYAK